MPKRPFHDDFRFKRRNGIFYVIFRFEPGRPRSTGQTTESDAIAWAYAHMNEPVRPNVTFADFTKCFFVPGECSWATRMLKKGRTFNAEYFTGHRNRLTAYMLPKFGPLLVSAITTKTIDEWLMDLKAIRTKEDLAAESKHKILVTLKKILEEAKYQGVIASNPAKDVSPFYDKSAGRDPFSISELHTLFPEDIDRLLHIWQTLPWATYFYVMASCGLRPGEAAALQWVDWIRSLHGVIVRWSVENKTGELKGLKTEKKGVQMKPAMLTARAETLLIMHESAQERTQLDDMVFQVNGAALKLETCRKHFRASCKRAGVELNGRTPYSLRHTFNTLVSKSATLSQLQTAMGHITMSSSQRYLHPEPEDLLEQAAPVRNIVERVFSTGVIEPLLLSVRPRDYKEDHG